jgi:hypothetical protein
MLLNELFGIFGATAKILANPDGNTEVAGMTGKILNIAPDHKLYYMEFENGQKVWVKAKNIQGVKPVNVK